MPEEGSRLLSPTSHDAPARINKVNVLLLLLAAGCYDAAVSGAVDMLAVFVVKEPLGWTAAQVSPFYFDRLLTNPNHCLNSSCSPCRWVMETQRAA